MKTFNETLTERIAIIEEIVIKANTMNNNYGYFKWNEFWSIPEFNESYEKLFINREEMMETSFSKKVITLDSIDTPIYNYFKKTNNEKYTVYNKVITDIPTLIKEYKNLFNYFYIEAQTVDVKLFEKLRKVAHTQNKDILKILKNEQNYIGDTEIMMILQSDEVSNIRNQYSRFIFKIGDEMRYLDNLAMELLGLPVEIKK